MFDLNPTPGSDFSGRWSWVACVAVLVLEPFAIHRISAARVTSVIWLQVCFMGVHPAIASVYGGTMVRRVVQHQGPTAGIKTAPHCSTSASTPSAILQLQLRIPRSQVEEQQHRTKGKLGTMPW
ncbi:hypothetical protein B0H12DRAFT_717907 [Mycena haematopus]|nr:hypothetical protein B0H12DRAFT_717907 [Mycena haematopus]